MANKVLFEIEVDAKFQELANLQRETDKLAVKQKNLKDKNQQNSATYQKQANEIRKLKSAMADTRKEIKNSENATKQLGTSYSALTAQNAILSKRLRSIQDPMGKNKVLFDKTALSIKNNTDKLKKMDLAMGRQQRNVGNYGAAFGAMTPMMGGFGSQIMMMQSSFAGLKTALLGADKAQKTTAVSSRMLAMAMMSIPIIAIVAAIGALVAAFSSTQRGADALSKVIEPLKAVFGALLGVMQELSFEAFDALKKAMNDPKQAMIDLGNVIKENIINRFKSFLVLGDAISLLMDGDYKAAMKKGADAVIQFNTGVANGTDKMAAFAEKTGEVIDKAIDAGAEIDRLQKQFEKLEIASIVPLAKLRLEFQKLKKAGNDQLASEVDRIVALEKAMEVQKEMARIEGNLIQLRIDKMIVEQGINDTMREGHKELQTLLAEQITFQEKATKKIAGLYSLQSGLEKKWLADKAKAAKQELKQEEKFQKLLIKLEIELYEKKKEELDSYSKALQAENDKIAKDNEDFYAAEFAEAKKDYDNRIALKEGLKDQGIILAQKTSDAIFNIAKQNVNRQKDYALDQLKIQDTLERDMLESRLESGAISQEEYENNRQALAERTAEKQLAIEKKAFEKQKKLSIAQALINGAIASTRIAADVNKADYGVATAIMIGAQVAATALEVATIQSQQFADGGLLQGASHDQGGIPFTIGGRAGFEAEGGEFMVNREATAKNLPLLQALNNETLRKPNYSGYNRHFANGGLVSQGINSQDLQNQASAIAQELKTLRVINVASETQAINDNAIRIENEYTL